MNRIGARFAQPDLAYDIRTALAAQSDHLCIMAMLRQAHPCQPLHLAPGTSCRQYIVPGHLDAGQAWPRPVECLHLALGLAVVSAQNLAQSRGIAAAADILP